MILLTLIAFSAGVTLGGISCVLLTQREWRRVRRECADKMKSSGDIQDTFYAMADMVYRGALQKLESEDTEGAKQELSGAIANFHRHFRNLSGKSSCIAAEVREVEVQARSSAILAAALEGNPNEKSIA